MARIAVIGGASASGKSTSMCPFKDEEMGIDIVGLDPDRTMIISAVKNELPVLGLTEGYKKKNRFIQENRYSEILAILMRIIESAKTGPLKIHNLVIDDAQFLMAFDFFNRRAETGYDKYSKIGYSFIELIAIIVEKLPDELCVFILMHTEKNDKGIEDALKTIGKMLDEKFTIPGLFNTVLIAEKEFQKGKKTMKYSFRTRPHYIEDIAKSPLGMFKSGKIPNDLNLVREGLLKL